MRPVELPIVAKPFAEPFSKVDGRSEVGGGVVSRGAQRRVGKTRRGGAPGAKDGVVHTEEGCREGLKVDVVEIVPDFGRPMART